MENSGTRLFLFLIVKLNTNLHAFNSEAIYCRSLQPFFTLQEDDLSEITFYLCTTSQKEATVYIYSFSSSHWAMAWRI